MDAIDNLIYATNFATITPAVPQPIGIPAPIGIVPIPPFFFLDPDKMAFASHPDAEVIRNAIAKHWFEIDAGINYFWPGLGQISTFNPAPYHLFYGYLLENTRIAQIFERTVQLYLTDESLGIANNNFAYQWLVNTELLFFKNTTNASYNIRSLLRPNFESNRRNAYYRMFGLDLSFGQNESTEKAKVANNQFIALFEQYLSEIWQAYINATNFAGPNTTDFQSLTDLATRIQELLNSRRGDAFANTYAFRNLSYEEYSSVILLTWLSFVLTYDSPVAVFLNCQSNTFGERLIKLGQKVGVPAHKKSQALFDLALPAANILTAIETGLVLNNLAFVTAMINRIPGPPLNMMNAFLMIINNWELATGHKIKNREANITGTVRVAQIARGTLVTN